MRSSMLLSQRVLVLCIALLAIIGACLAAGGPSGWAQAAGNQEAETRGLARQPADGEALARCKEGSAALVQAARMADEAARNTQEKLALCQAGKSSAHQEQTARLQRALDQLNDRLRRAGLSSGGE
jgi:hypothetical protein